MTDPQTTPAPDIYERVARLEKLVDRLYGRTDGLPAPTIPNFPLKSGACFICGDGTDHGGLQCPKLAAH